MRCSPPLVSWVRYASSLPGKGHTGATIQGRRGLAGEGSCAPEDQSQRVRCEATTGSRGQGGAGRSPYNAAASACSRISCWYAEGRDLVAAQRERWALNLRCPSMSREQPSMDFWRGSPGSAHSNPGRTTEPGSAVAAAAPAMIARSMWWSCRDAGSGRARGPVGPLWAGGA